jgi:hypothetical protein
VTSAEATSATAPTQQPKKAIARKVGGKEDAAAAWDQPGKSLDWDGMEEGKHSAAGGWENTSKEITCTQQQLVIQTTSSLAQGPILRCFMYICQHMAFSDYLMIRDL